MKYEKFGNFVAELRKRKNCTQIELAKEIHVSNKTVSKWECGNGLPDVSILIPLAKALGVSVTELLSGEFIEEESIKKSKVEEMTINNLNDSKKGFTKKIRHLIFLIIVIIALAILALYFITTFNSVKLYKISLNSNDFEIKTGSFMKTKIKSVFELGEIEYVGNEEIEKDLYVRLYAKNNDDEIVLYEGLYTPINIYERYGYEEYLTNEFEKLIQDNLYITINYKLINGNEMSQSYNLDVSLDFANNRLFNFGDNEGVLETTETALLNYKNASLDTILMANGFSKSDNNSFVKEDSSMKIKVEFTDDVIIYLEFQDYNVYYFKKRKRLKIFENDMTLFNDSIKSLKDYPENLSKLIDELYEVINLFEE